MGSIRLGEGHWATRLVALGRGQAALDGHGQGGKPSRKLYSDVLLLPVRRRWTIDLGAWRAGLGCVLSVLQRAEFRRWAHSRSLCLPKAAWAHSRGGPGDVRLILVELVAQQADRLLVANEGPAVPLLRQLHRRRPPPLISGPMRLTNAFLRGLHRRVLLLRLCQAVPLCLGLAFHACALRARVRAASAGNAPTAGSVIATTIVYRCDLTTRLPPCFTVPSPALRSD